ncbi:MAG: DUF4193 family protein [Acidimicrobiales bacterium]
MPTEMGDEVDADVIEDDDELDDLGDEAALDEDLDDVLEVDEDLEDDDGLGSDDDTDDVVADVVLAVPVGDAPLVVGALVDSEEAVADDEEDELDDDDVEASLDVILKERLVVEDEEEEEDEEEVPDADDRGEGTSRVLPKQPGEFVCQSCFLVKSETQLADSARMLCRDCV